jgi:DNA-binding transcriptional LysR family regulator
MPTRDSVDSVLNNTVDLALVTLPVRAAQLRITPLRSEMSVAILPADTTDIPDVVTPAYAARQPLVLEFARAAGHTLVSQWLAEHMPLPGQPMLIATVEAMKSVVSMGLGMAIVPDVAVATPIAGIVVRPLDPPLPCTMGLIEHRNKPNSPAQKIVRSALLELRTDASSEAG